MGAREMNDLLLAGWLFMTILSCFYFYGFIEKDGDLPLDFLIFIVVLFMAFLIWPIMISFVIYKKLWSEK